MSESLEIIVEIIAIISFGATVVNYIVIKPLRISIDMLSTAVQELKKLLFEVEREEKKLDKEVAINKRNIEDLQDQVDSLSNRVDTLQSYHTKP